MCGVKLTGFLDVHHSPLTSAVKGCVEDHLRGSVVLTCPQTEAAVSPSVRLKFFQTFTAAAAVVVWPALCFSSHNASYLPV